MIITSKQACGKVNYLAKFIGTNKWAFCGVIFILGLVLLLIGGSHWKNLITFLGFVSGFAGSLFIFYAFVRTKENVSSQIMIYASSLIIGCLVGALCRTFNILSYILLGFFTGLTLSTYLLSVLHFSGEEWLLILIKYGSGVILALFCCFV